MVVAAAAGVGCWAVVDPIDMEKGSEAKNSLMRKALKRDILILLLLLSYR